MFLAILTFLSAITISAVAIYYSVAGLAAIFAAAVIPIIIMGVSLEVGKLVTAVWLHRNWNRAVWWLKTYLSIAVVVLMFITSMGIFGYLSKAHIEQTSLSIEQSASIETLDEKMIRSNAKIERWENEMDRLLKGDDVRVDTLVEKEQIALNKVYERINAEKKTANDQANSDIDVLIKEKDSAIANADREIKLQTDRLNQAKERKEAINLIHPDASVLTTNDLVPHLSRRKIIAVTDQSQFNRLNQYDQILIDKRHPGWQSSIELVNAINKKLKVVEAGAQGQHKLSRGYLPQKTWSAHWIKEKEFSKAIGKFLDEETKIINLKLDKFQAY